MLKHGDFPDTRPPPTPIRGGRDESELELNTADFEVVHHLWGHWAFIRTSQLLTLNCIGPPLVMDKLIPVISRAITTPPEMGPLLDVE